MSLTCIVTYLPCTGDDLGSESKHFKKEEEEIDLVHNHKELQNLGDGREKEAGGAEKDQPMRTEENKRGTVMQSRFRIYFKMESWDINMHYCLPGQGK